MKCWATEFSPCKEGQSGEHVVSASLFSRQRTIRVEGSLWPGKKPIELPLNALRSNILCRHHNSVLAPIDAAGGRAFSSLRDAFALVRIRANIRSRPWWVVAFQIDGALLECWFIKTAIDVFAARASKQWWADPANRVPGPLLDVIFRGAPLTFPAGLYAFDQYESEHSSADSIEFRALPALGGRFVGGLFDFRGYRFLIWLTSEFEPAPHVPPEQGKELKYHLRAFDHVLNGHLSHRVTFHWGTPGSAA